MSRRTLFLMLYSLGIVFVVCLCVGVIVLFDGRTAFAWVERKFADQADQGSTAVVPVQVTPTASTTITPTPTPTPLCGGPASMMLVLIGTDSRADSYYAGLADSIRLIRVDFVDPGIMILPFLRDLYVEIPGLAEHGITHGKLNQAYTYGTPAFGYYDSTNQGLNLMTQTMELNFGVHVDNGIVVNMQSFVRIVDALGGIDIYLPYAIDGRVKGSKDPNLYFEAGNQHLDGYRTQILARLRPNGDVERAKIQNLILKALGAKLLSPDVLPRLPELIKIYQESAFTDLSPAQIAQLTCLAPKLDSQKINYVNFPDDLLRGTRVQDPVLGYTFVWDVDFSVLRSYIDSFKNGTWPDTPIATPSP